MHPEQLATMAQPFLVQTQAQINQLWQWHLAARSPRLGQRAYFEPNLLKFSQEIGTKTVNSPI